MNYSFINKKGAVQIKQIPDADIATLRRTLQLSENEAAELWLFDHDFIENAEADALTEKAKANKMNAAGRAGTKRERKPVERKKDEEKRVIIESVYDSALNAFPALFDNMRDIEVTNPERIISFSLGDNEYTLTLSRKRKAK